MSRHITGGIAAMVAAGVILALLAGTASAHARLEESTPAVGEVVQASPLQVSVTFSQEIQKITGTYGIDVFDANDTEVTTEDAVLSDDDRRILTVDLPASLPPGRYVVRYKNVSDADGDPFEGAYAFYVGREPTAAEMALDAQLVPAEEETPTAAAATSTPVTQETVAPTPVATPASANEDDDTGGNLTLILVIAGLAVLVVLVLVGFFALSRAQSRDRG